MAEIIYLLSNGKWKVNSFELKVDELKRWHVLLGKDGINSKAVVRDEIKKLLDKLKKEEVKK